MPVTAKLSREFYERLGDSVANELVEMLNTVDQNYRTELREMNELNFARFDAKVEQRFAESAALTDKRFAEAAALTDRRFAESAALTDKRFAEAAAAIDKRFADAAIDRRFAESAAEMDRGFAKVGASIDQLRADMATTAERTTSYLLKWSFSFWVTTLVTLYAFTRTLH